MPTERKLKGINFLGTLEALEREHEAETRARVEGQLEGQVGEAIRQHEVLASGWYPASWYAELLQTIVSEVGGGSDTARSLSRAAVATDFSTLFKIVRLFLKPEMAAKQGLRVSRRYVDGGTIDVVKANRGMMQIRFREYHGYTRLMWWDFIGGVEGVLCNMGAEDITSRILAGGSDGDHHVEVLLRWQI